MSLLLQPLSLGRSALPNRPIVPNRVVFGAHVTNFGKGNVFTARHRAYYRERAAGGAGLIVTEALTVHPLDWPYEHVPFGHRDAIVPSLLALGEELRSAALGAGLPAPLIVAQLSHTGGQTHGRLLRQSPWAPSAVPDVASKKMARAMDAGQIEQVVEGFAAAAARVRQGGLDGVELNAGQHALLRQFLSPLTNFRQDEYGGPLENRMRLLLRVIAAVRGALGPEPVLGVKLTGDELAPWGGLQPEHCAELAQRLVAAGGLDYLSVQIGGPYSTQITDAGMPTPQGHAAHLAAAIRQAIGGALPVFAEGRIESVPVAERILAQGQADGCVMTRALISDPALPRKLADADPEPIRPHAGMNRYFLVKGDWNRPLSDLANPRAGREERFPSIPPLHKVERGSGGEAGGQGSAAAQSLTPLRPLAEAAPLPRRGAPATQTSAKSLSFGEGPAPFDSAQGRLRAEDEAAVPPLHKVERGSGGEAGGQGSAVLVIGGGPAGMEAALTLARLGRRVRLVEASAALGGMAARLAEQVPARAEFGPLVDWYRAMLARHGVTVELNRPVRGDEDWLAGFARILVATGAEAPPALWTAPPGLALATPRDLLAQDARKHLPPPSAGRALVIDSELGFRMGNAVEWLLEAGYGVDVATEDFFVGRELVESAELLWFNRVAQSRGDRGGATFHPRLRMLRFEQDGAGAATCTAALRDRFAAPDVAGAERRFPGLALAVYVAPERPLGSGSGDTLRETLRARGLNAESIGDARAPRLMGEAIQHAHQVGRG